MNKRTVITEAKELAKKATVEINACQIAALIANYHQALIDYNIDTRTVRVLTLDYQRWVLSQ